MRHGKRQKAVQITLSWDLTQKHKLIALKLKMFFKHGEAEICLATFHGQEYYYNSEVDCLIFKAVSPFLYVKSNTFSEFSLDKHLES